MQKFADFFLHHPIQTPKGSSFLNTYTRFLIILSLSFFSFSLASSQISFLENGEHSLLASTSGLYGGSTTRKTLDLSGDWEFSLDEKQTWQSVKVPSCYDGIGKIWFRRSFSVSEDVLEQYASSLVCFGVNYFCEITINDNFVGRHIGGSTSFSFLLEKNVLQLGSNNTIVIYVDNELNARNTLPLRHQVRGWRNYGGIYRDIFLLFTPKMFLNDIVVKTKLSPNRENATVNVRATVYNAGFSLQQKNEDGGKRIAPLALIEIIDKDSGVVVAKSSILINPPEENNASEFSISLSLSLPRLWSPETPSLYDVRCTLLSSSLSTASVLDESARQIGVRTIEIHGNQILLNGSQIRMKGVAWNEDHPQLGIALSYAALERDITAIKNLGANLIRFANHSVHPYLLTLCDKYGIFVLEELPLTNAPLSIINKDDYRETVAAIAKEMVVRDRNHSSLFAWGIGNNFESNSPEASEFTRSIKNAVRNNDDRPVYFITSDIADNLCFAEMDFVAFKITSTDVQATKRTLKQWTENYTEKPTLVLGFGKEIEPGNRNGTSDPYSYESQARTIQLFLEGVKDIKISGTVINSFNDFRNDRPSLSVRSQDPYLSTFGIVNENREKRTAYDVLRSLYNGEKISALKPGVYSFTTPMFYVAADVILLIILAFFYNQNRRFRENINRSIRRTYNFFADVRDQRIISFGQTLLVSLLTASAASIVLSSLFFHYRGSFYLDAVLSHLLISDTLKQFLITIVWSPSSAILWLAVFFLVLGLFIAVVIKFLSFFRRARIQFLHTYEVVVWSMLPVLLFLFIGMIMFRLLDSSLYVYVVFGLLIATLLWIFQRLLKGIAVIFDVFAPRAYLLGVVIIILTGVGMYSYYDYTYSTSAYLQFLFEVSRNIN